LYLARWTKGRLWVVGYRLTGGAKPSDYVRTEGRIPRRFETADWYGTVPDEVAEAFLEVGVLLDDPPFPVPAPPPLRPAAPPRRPASPAAPRPATARAAARPAAGRAARAETTRVCASCRMHKAAAQFVPGSDLCVDCR
ncbi:MAG TPA: hypothetical protein VFO65_10635, partial [Acidimicrobiales bacterium]|nr:hypothetical protein [Acidimicrobiales bacterium]